ncbi:MAG: hypothetical protein JXO51_07055 [Candidatus Aminicenantes bacterium]|nr:hypothetical protein [Candidatus Aminicenantes bacterium]
MNSRKLFWILGAAALIAAFSGCSEKGSDGQAGPAGAAAPRAASSAVTAPCALIVKAQVEAIFGEPFQEGEDKSRERHPLGQRICFWNTAKPGSFRFLQVSIIRTSAMPAGKSPGAAAIFRQTRETLTPIQDVVDVADEAFWGTMGLHLLQGEAYVNIAVGSSDQPGNLEIAKKVAAIILPRLRT